MRSGGLELEQLEPRILLSADSLFGAVALADQLSTEDHNGVIEEPLFGTTEQYPTQEYDFSAAREDIFDGLDGDEFVPNPVDSEPGSGADSGTEATSNPVDSVAEPPGVTGVDDGLNSGSFGVTTSGVEGLGFVPNASTGAGEDAEQHGVLELTASTDADPFPGQLTETLIAANAPPQAGFSDSATPLPQTSTDDSAAGSFSIVHGGDTFFAVLSEGSESGALNLVREIEGIIEEMLEGVNTEGSNVTVNRQESLGDVDLGGVFTIASPELDFEVNYDTGDDTWDATVVITAGGMSLVIGTGDTVSATVTPIEGEDDAVTATFTLDGTGTTVDASAGTFVLQLGDVVFSVSDFVTAGTSLVTMTYSQSGGLQVDPLTNVTFEVDLTLGETAFFTATGEATFLIEDAGVAAVVDLTLQTGEGLEAYGVALDATLELRINTTGAPVEQIGTTTVDLPAGPYVMVTLTDSALTIAGSRLSATEFVFERGADGTVTLGGTGVSFELRTGSGEDANRIVGVLNADFNFVFSDDGVYGAMLNAEVAGPDFSGDLFQLEGIAALHLNTTQDAQSVTVSVPTEEPGVFDPQEINLAAAAVEDAYIMVSVAAGVLVIAGSSVRAETLTFKKEGSTVSIGGTDVSFELRAGSASEAPRIVGLENADFHFVFDENGFFGGMNGDLIGPEIGSLSFAGNISLEINTTGQAQGPFMVGEEGVSLPAGGDNGFYLKLVISGIGEDPASVSLGSIFSITADEISLEVDGDDVHIVIDDMTFSAGDVFEVGGSLDMTITPTQIVVTEASLTFAGDFEIGTFFSITTPGLSLSDFVYVHSGADPPDTGMQSGVIGISAGSAELFPGQPFSADATGIDGSFNLVTGAFSITLDTFTLTAGSAFEVDAAGITIQYDPADDGVQELVKIMDGTITILPISLSATVSNLSIRTDGFGFGELTVEVEGDFALGGIMTLVDPGITIKDFNVVYGESFSFTGSITVFAGEAAFFPGNSFFSAELTGVAATVNFNAAGEFQSFVFAADELSLSFGAFLTIEASDVNIDTGAVGGEYVAQFGSVGASINAGVLTIGGSAQNFAITAEGDFVTLDQFGFAFSVSADDADAFQLPSWLPSFSIEIELQWKTSFSEAPADFYLILSGSLTNASLPGFSAITLSGSVQDLVIDVGLLTQGKFPIVGIGSIELSVEGEVGGLSFSGGLAFGLIRLDAEGERIAGNDLTTEAAESYMYGAIMAGVEIAGKGLELRFGLSEAGPLAFFVSAQIPILLEPNSGLMLTGIRGGVSFGKTIPEPENAEALSGSEYGSTGDQSFSEWVAGLEEQVITLGNAGGGMAFLSEPMVFELGASISSMHIAGAIEGEVDFMMDTQGRFVIGGQITFADALTDRVRIYGDLADLPNMTMMFLLERPAESPIVKKFGELTMEFIAVSEGGERLLQGVLNDENEAVGGTLQPGETLLVRITLAGGAEFDLLGFAGARLEGTVTVDITTVKLTVDFDATLAINPLMGQVGAAAGRLVLDYSDGIAFWGVLKVTANLDGLSDYGVSGTGWGLMQFNTTNEVKTETITLPESDPEEFQIASGFRMSLQAELIFSVDDSPVFAINGAAAFAITADGVDAYVNGTLTLGSSEEPLLTFNVLGVLLIRSNGIAAMFELGFETPEDENPAVPITMTADLFLQLNTFEQEMTYTIPEELPPLYQDTDQETRDIVITAYPPSLDGASGPAAAHVVIMGAGSMTIDGVFELQGSFRIMLLADRFELEMDMTMSLEPLGQLDARGTLVITEAGIVAGLQLGVQGSTPSDVGEGDLAFTALFQFEMNTTNGPAEITRYKVDPSTKAIVSGEMETVTIAAGTVRIFAAGEVAVAGTLAFNGSFTLVYAGETLEVHFDARIEVQAGSHRIFDADVEGYLNISSEGLVAVFVLSLRPGGGPDSNLGFSFSIDTFRLEINTTGSSQIVTLTSGTVFLPAGQPTPHLRLFIAGSLTIGPATLDGSFAIQLSGDAFSISINATISVFGTTLSASGFASVYSGASPGIVVSIQLRLGGGTNVTVNPVDGLDFTVRGSFQLELNTTNQTREGIAPNSFAIAVSDLYVNLFGFELSGSLRIGISHAGLEIYIPSSDPLTLDFFGFLTLSVSGKLETNGNFSFTASASVTILNPDVFGFTGSVSVTFSNDGFAGSLSGTFGAFGIKVSAGGDFFIQSGLVKISVRISLQITPAFSFKFWKPFKTFRVHVPAVVISGNWSMTFGALTTAPEIPPPPSLARTSGNTLFLNIGEDVHHRGEFYPADDESYLITAVGLGSETGQRIQVSALGFDQEFDNITHIVARNTQSYNNYIAIDNDVMATVAINVGKTVTGENRFMLGGGAAIVEAGPGRHVVEFGAGGGTYIGGAGDSSITDHSGGSLTVKAPGFDEYVLSDGSLTYGDGDEDTIPYIMTFVGNSVENVILEGAANATYETSNLPGIDDEDGSTVPATPWTGNATFTGSGSSSVLRAGSTGNLTLTNSSLADSSTSAAVTLNNIAIAHLVGGDGANTFNVSGWTQNGSINGGGGSDTVVATNNANFALSDSSLTRSSGGTLELAGVEIANLTGGGGANAFTVDSWTGSALLDGTGGSDTYTINLTGSGSGTVTVADTGASGTDALTVNGTAGSDLFTVSGTAVTLGVNTETVNYSGVETLTVNGTAGNDTFVVNDTSIPTTINGGAGNDLFTVNHSSASLVMNGDTGNDTFNIRTIAAPATLNTGSGTNTVNVGSTAGSLGGISEKLTVNGQGTLDTVHLNDSGAWTDRVGILSANRITGLGMAGGASTKGVEYSGIEVLNLNLGSGSDTFTILGTHAGTTTVNTGGGNDRINIRSISGPTTANTGVGNDLVYVGSQAGLGDSGGTLNAIAAALTIHGGTGTDSLFLDDSGDPTANTGVLTGSTVSGLGMGGVLTYDAFAVLHLNLGSGGDTLFIEGTHAGVTHIDTGGGDDTVRVGRNTATPSVTLNAMLGELNIAGGGGFNTLIGDDSAAAQNRAGSLTADTITGLGMGHGISYLQFDMLEIELGSGDDTFAIDSTHTGSTLLNAGPGDDVVNIQTIAGITTINGGPGGDTINIGSNAPGADGTLNGIAAALIVDGQTGANVLNLDDTGDAAPTSGNLTASTVNGLGLSPAGITYLGMMAVSIRLGDGDNTFTVDSTHTGTTYLHSGAGDDEVNVRTIHGITTIHGGAGNDTINVGTLAPETHGNLNSIGAHLSVDGGTGTNTLNVDDTGDDFTNTGTLTDTALTGLGMSDDGLTYANIALLNISLGSGDDVFTIDSTYAGTTTNLFAGAGNDQIRARTISGPTHIYGESGDNRVWVGTKAPASDGTVNGIAAPLVVDGGSGHNELYVDDTGDPEATTGTLTETTITGLGMTDGVTYTNIARLEIELGSGGNRFTVNSTHTGATELDSGTGDDTIDIVGIAGATWIHGNDGDDVITVNPDHVTDNNPIGAVLHLDGNDGSDTYFIYLTGTGESLINVHDSGGIADTDALTLYGTPFDDTFLLRKDFIVLLQYIDGDQLGTYERINYDQNINGMLTINAVGGQNHFAIDDNSSITTINGSGDGVPGEAGDTFQIGQLFGAEFAGDGPGAGIGFGAGDLLETTRGWLSPGVTNPLTINGGDGNNTFTVYHNRAVLNLSGGDGNDTFIVRSFALAGSFEAQELYDDDRDTTNIAAGGGDDHIEYAVNAPVSIDGGSGFNTVVVIGTEFGDKIVVTQDGVYGSGLFVEFVNVQELVVHGAEGNDNIWVLGTPEGVSVRIVGGLGSDSIHVGGNPGTVVSNDLRGHSGLIGHGIDTGDPDRDAAFDDVHVPGISANVADNDGPGVVLTEAGGRLQVYEGGEIPGFLAAHDSYTVVLTHAPAAPVTVTVSAQRPSPAQQSRGEDTILVSSGTAPGTFERSITLEFSEENWNTPQTVYVQAAGDDAAQGERTHVISHSLNSGDEGYNNLPVRNIPVTVFDNDAAGIILLHESFEPTVFEGGATDAYAVVLTRQPTGNVTVNLFPDEQVGVSSDTLTFTSENWNVPQLVTIQAVDDNEPEGRHHGFIHHELASADVDFDGISGGRLTVLVQDNDAPGVHVEERDGSTNVIEGGTAEDGAPFSDTYTVVLTKQPSGPVTINLEALPTATSNFPGGPFNPQVELSVNQLTFTPENWDQPQTVTVTAMNDEVVNGGDYKVFTSNFRVSDIRGPLMIDGGIGDGIPPLQVGIGLPGEQTGPLLEVDNPNLFVEEEDQVDRVIIHNDHSVANDEAVLTADRLYGLGMVEETTIQGNTFPAGIQYKELEEVIINLGSGNNTLTIESTHEGRTIIQGGRGDDTFNIRTIDGHTTLFGAEGEDTFNVGTLAPGTGGDVNGIQALLTIDGGAGNNVLNVDDRAEVADVTGILTQSTLTGLGMRSDLATANDLIQLTVTATGGSYMLGHNGTSVEVAWDADHHALTAALWELLGNRNAAALTFGDVALINLQGELRGDGVELTVDASGLTHDSGVPQAELLRRTDGINYYAIDMLNIALGDGADVFNVQGTTAATNLMTRGGDDRIYVSSEANLDLDTATDFLRGHLDRITGALNIDAGTGRNLLMISDEANPVASGTAEAPARITDQTSDLFAEQLARFGSDVFAPFLGLPDPEIVIEGLAPAPINYRADVAGDYTGGITVWSGFGDDYIQIDGTHYRENVRTVTTLNTGLGDDHIVVDLHADKDGFFVLNTEGPYPGNDEFEIPDWAVGITDHDTVDASSSTLPLVIFGGDGDDTITGGQAGDIIFGDRGRVHYADDNGEVVAVLGGGGPGDRTDGVIRPASAIFSVDHAVGGANAITGGEGDDVIVGGPGSDAIDAGEGENVVFGDNGRIELVAGIPVLITTTAPGIGGDDTITAGSGNDIVLGGHGDDTITIAGGDNVVIGDHGRIEAVAGLLQLITATEPTLGGDDTITTGSGNDIILGGTGSDWIETSAGNNLIFGDHGRVEANDGHFIDSSLLPLALPHEEVPFTFTSIYTGLGDGGGADVIIAGPGENIIIGGQGDDIILSDAGDDDIIGGHNVAGGAAGNNTIDGGPGNNVIAGDNASILRRPDTLSPIHRALEGETLYHLFGSEGFSPDYQPAVTDDWQPHPDGVAGRNILLFDHHHDETADWMFGDDRIAGGPGHDLLFGQMGDDIIHGDGWIEVVFDEDRQVVSVVLRMAEDPSTDGNDYIEGGGGNDLIIGGLGQDDIIGGSSNLFGLDDARERPNGSNMIFGGNGVTLWRYEGAYYWEGNLPELPAGELELIYVSEVNAIDRDHLGPQPGGPGYADRHARDADVILGDNGVIFRIVGTNGQGSGQYLEFNYDRFDPTRGELRIIPRAFGLLDYVPGVGDPSADGIHGGGDIIYGEDGDDIIHGMHGNNVIYGGAGDDDLYGGVGHDWISGGAGEDGILGDDGRIFTSRNSSDYGEPLHGIAPLPASELNKHISIPGNHLQAVINVEGELSKAVDLEPFDIGGHDIIYGGRGGSFLHGGAGDDAISGAEALAVSAAVVDGHVFVFEFDDPHGIRANMDHALIDAHGVLDYGRNQENHFGLFDPDDPMRKVMINPATGQLEKDVNNPDALEFLLNFDAFVKDANRQPVLDAGGGMILIDYGNDRIFGGDGNAWLVAGTGNNRLWGGRGDNLLNLNNNLDTNGGLNDQPDDPMFAFADIAYGGAGRDILIANTAKDRLIDWAGSYNTFLVPFSPYGMPTVIRNGSPAIIEFLLELSKADGADQTRIGDLGDGRYGDPDLNGEPYGEIGLVTQQHEEWQDQTGGPDSPHPGNQGGPRDDTGDFGGGGDDGSTDDGGTAGTTADVASDDDDSSDVDAGNLAGNQGEDEGDGDAGEDGNGSSGDFTEDNTGNPGVGVPGGGKGNSGGGKGRGK